MCRAEELRDLFAFHEGMPSHLHLKLAEQLARGEIEAGKPAPKEEGGEGEGPITVHRGRYAAVTTPISHVCESAQGPMPHTTCVRASRLFASICSVQCWQGSPPSHTK